MEQFTQAQIDELRAMYAKFDRVDPDVILPRIHAMFAKMHPATIKQLSEANIKFVSKLAQNQMIRLMAA